MNKAEMADRLAAQTDLSKTVAREAVDGVFAAIGDAFPMARKSGLWDSGPSVPETGRPVPDATRGPERRIRYRRRHRQHSRPEKRLTLTSTQAKRAGVRTRVMTSGLFSDYFFLR